MSDLHLYCDVMPRGSWIHSKSPHLVEVGPVGADGQLNLSPAACGGARGVPHRHPQRTIVFFDVDVKLARVAVVSASHVVVEDDAMGVVLLQLGRQQQSLLPRKAS